MGLIPALQIGYHKEIESRSEMVRGNELNVEQSPLEAAREII